MTDKERLGDHTDGVLGARAGTRSNAPVNIAREAIKELEAKIFDEFGMRVRIGTEIEFAGKVKPDVQFKSNPMELYGSNLAKRGYKPSARRSGAMEEYLRTKPGTYDEEWAKKPSTETKDLLFPDSPYVCYSYVEGTHSLPYYKYEVVLSHQGVEKRERHLDGSKPYKSPTQFSRALLMGDVIEQMHAIILGSYPSEANFRSPQHAEQKALHDLFDETTIASSVKDITNGMHINVGLQPVGGKLKDPHQPVRTQHLMVSSIKNLSFENLYLFGLSDEAARRYESRNGLKQVSGKQMYVENAVPGGDANPYYSILVTLAGTYNALCKDAGSPNYVEIKNGQRTAHEAYPDAKAAWNAPDNALRSILDKVKPGLGQSFGDAIKETEPGKEARLFHDPSRYDVRGKGGK